MNSMRQGVDEELLIEKEETIQELRETVEILELKVKKLEQLVRLKDSKIQALQNQQFVGWLYPWTDLPDYLSIQKTYNGRVLYVVELKVSHQLKSKLTRTFYVRSQQCVKIIYFVIFFSVYIW